MIERLWRVAGWLGIVATLALSLTPPTLGENNSHTDKLVHMAGYAVLMFWWAQMVGFPRWRLALAVVLFGGAIELLQGLTPDRMPDLLDVFANTLGVLLGWFAARRVPRLPPLLATRYATLPASRR